MKKRIGELEEFEFETLTEGKDLQVVLTVSGWLTKEKLSKQYKLVCLGMSSSVTLKIPDTSM